MRKLTSSQSLFLLVLMGFLLTLPAALWLRSRQQQQIVSDLREKPGLKPGDSVTATALQNLQGGTIDLLKSEEGYLLLCFFSAEGCPRCPEEAAVWRQLIDEGPQRNTRTFLVAMDKDLATLRRYVDAHGLESMPVLYDPQGRVLTHFRAQILPQYLLFDRTGKVIHRELGYSKVLGIDSAQRTQAILRAIPPLEAASVSTGTQQ